MRRPKQTRRVVKVLLNEDAIGEWVRYYSWTERTKFLIKSIDINNQKIYGTYVMDGRKQKDTKFNLCKGVATERIDGYWHLIDDEKLDFSLDDKLFEI